jgi:hypothetical protein
MSYIGPEPYEAFTSYATETFTTSSTTSYTLAHSVANENELALFINNVRQQPGSGKAYTASGTALTLSAATASTDTMYAIYLGRALQTSVPHTNSITKTMLATTATNAPNFFIAGSGTAQTLNHASHTKFTNWATSGIIDTASDWDADNSRYTFGTAGKYLVSASLYFTIAAFDKRLQMSVRKNGSAHILSTVSSGKNNSANIAYMNEYAATDYLEIFGYQDQSSGNITMGDEESMTFMSIVKVVENS